MQHCSFVGQFARSRAGADPKSIVLGCGEGLGRSKPDWRFSRPLLTFDRVFQLIISRKLKFPKREEKSMFKRCEGQGRGGMWRYLYLFLKKPIILVIFLGGRGIRISWPPPLNEFITQKSRESVETIDAPQIYGGKQIRAASWYV